MRFSPALLIAVFAASSALAHPGPPAFSEGGSHVRDGGTGLRCWGEDGPIILFEQANQKVPGGSDPAVGWDEFIAQVFSRIQDPFFSRLLREQLDRYGDPMKWPEGDLRGSTVFYSGGDILQPRPYGADGVIAADAPKTTDCRYPLYFIDACCDRVLLSYFGPDDAKPHRFKFFDRLDPAQRNILRLHEAIYRMVRTLAQYPSPTRDAPVEPLDHYAFWRKVAGEVPNLPVEILVTALLDARDPDPKLTVDSHFHMVWDWAWFVYAEPNPLPPATARSTPSLSRY